MERNEALQVIYSVNRDMVFGYILKNSGTMDEAKDVYQEAIIAFYENVRNNAFNEKSTIGTYIYSIAKFKWLNQIKKNSVRTRHHENLEVERFEKGPLSTLLAKEQKAGVLEVLSHLGDGCKKLLVETMYHNTSMKEIVTQGTYSSEQIARNKKYKCLKKLRELISNQPELKKRLVTYE